MRAIGAEELRGRYHPHDPRWLDEWCGLMRRFRDEGKRCRRAPLALPPSDFYLLDDKTAMFLHFTGDGQANGYTVTGAPDVVSLCRTSFQAVWDVSKHTMTSSPSPDSASAHASGRRQQLRTRRAFNLALLATAYAQQGEPDQAATVACEALAMTGRLKSARAAAYLRRLQHRLAPHRTRPAVRKFLTGVEATLRRYR